MSKFRLDLWTSDGRTVIAPVSIPTHLIFIVLAFVLSLFLYTSLIASLHKSYFEAFKGANIICSTLTAYGNSACGQSESKKKDFLRPSELLSLLEAADIEQSSDYPTPNKILELKKSGVGSWLATLIIEPPSGPENRIDTQFLNPVLDEGSTGSTGVGLIGSSQGSIFPLVYLYSQIGVSGTNKANNPVTDDLPKFEEGALSLARDITGYRGIPDREGLLDRLSQYYPFSSRESYSTSESVKRALEMWHLYNWEYIEASSAPLKNNTLFELTFSEGGYKAGHAVRMAETKWYKENPEHLQQALHSLGLMVVSRIVNSDEVKIKRYAFQAMEGVIQFAIITYVLYIGLLLLWRFFASLVPITPMQEHKKIRIHWFHRPRLYMGPKSGFEEAIPRSREFINHLIETLPMFGLFGTVIGILMGLPKAAAAIVGTGPDSKEQVFALFTDLSLAFSTTAIALLSLVVLQLIWLLIKFFEDHRLFHALVLVPSADSPPSNKVDRDQ